MVTFLFAGDGSLASEGTSAFLQTKSNYMLVAECRDGAIAIGKIESLNPQVAVIDAHLPDMSADEIAAEVRARGSRTKIVVLGLSANREEADRVLRGGADAYVIRSGPSRHLTDAIRHVQGGAKYLDPLLTVPQPAGAEQNSGAAELPLNDDAIQGLWIAVECQARTMERLDQAISRAECAIELLQQKLEQLAGVAIEVPPTPPHAGPEVSGEKQRLSARLRAGLSVVAAFCLSERLDSTWPAFCSVSRKM
jgi:DNA-binding NarL/FixJ family response regulator